MNALSCSRLLVPKVFLYFYPFFFFFFLVKSGLVYVFILFRLITGQLLLSKHMFSAMNLFVYFMISLILGCGIKISDSLFFNLIAFVQHVMCWISFNSNWTSHLASFFAILSYYCSVYTLVDDIIPQYLVLILKLITECADIR